MNTIDIVTLSFMSALVFVTGCAAESADPHAEETVASTSQAVTCIQPAGIVSQYIVLGAPGTVTSATTQDLAGYGSPSSPCAANLFPVQIDSTLGKDLTPFAAYAGPAPTNATTCEGSFVHATLYGYLPAANSSAPAHWVEVAGPVSAGGIWRGSRCQLPEVEFAEETHSPYEYIEVSAAAESSSGSLTDVTDGAIAH
jgi:hypothetical protein